MASLFKIGYWNEKELKSPNMEALAQSARKLVMSARQPATVSKYARGFEIFSKWATTNNAVPLPARGEILGLYLTRLVEQRKSLSCFYSALYSVKWAHVMCGLEDPCSHPLVRMVTESAKRSLRRTVNKRVPITPDLMRAIYRKYGNSNLLKHDRFVCVAFLAYFGFLRINEVLKVKRSHIEFKESHMTIWLPKSKADVYGKGATVTISANFDSICPVSKLQQYLQKTGDFRINDRFIFREIVGFELSQKNKPLNYSRAREQLLEFLNPLVLDTSNYGWHSFRRGGASEASSSGVPDRLLKLHGRWRSEAAKDGYIQENLNSVLSVSKSLLLS